MVIECFEILNDVIEILMLDVVQYFFYLQGIVNMIFLYDLDVFIGFFIGRDVIEVYYVLDQIIGFKDIFFV